jgi:transketolase
VWEVDGHDIEALANTLDELSQCSNGKPQLLVAHTVKGKGVSFMENEAKWHHGVPSAKRLELALREIRNGLKL